MSTYEQELSKIGMWITEEWGKDEDSIYLCFLRLLADYHNLKAEYIENAIRIQEKRERRSVP